MSNRDSMVNIDKNKWAYYKKWTSSKKDKRALFSTMKDLFLFAAAYGFKHCEPKKLPTKTEKPFRWSNFSDDDRVIIKAIALNTTKNAEIILDNEKMLKIVEEYANAGIDELDRIIGEPGESEVHVLEILSEIEEK